MPLSHDAKPRNRARRQKYNARLTKHHTTNALARFLQRQAFQSFVFDAENARRHVEALFRANGIRWHTVTKTYTPVQILTMVRKVQTSGEQVVIAA